MQQHTCRTHYEDNFLTQRTNVWAQMHGHINVLDSSLNTFTVTRITDLQGVHE